MKLSAIIIAKNAEGEIADAIESVKSLADEVIIVDSGSTDRTVEIAKYCKAEVINVEKKDFSQLRNMGLKEARGEWLLYIDTDERVSPQLVSSIKYLASRRSGQVLSIRDKPFSAYKIKRKNFYLGNNEWPYIEKIERLFRKDALRGWKGQLHESPIIVGEGLPAGRQVGELDGFLLHYTHRDLASMLEKTIEWSKVEAELRFKSGHPKMTWWRFFRVMVTAFFDSYIKQDGWKVGMVGLIESIYQAFSMFVTYARLWEMQSKK